MRAALVEGRGRARPRRQPRRPRARSACRGAAVETRARRAARGAARSRSALSRRRNGRLRPGRRAALRRPARAVWTPCSPPRFDEATGAARPGAVDQARGVAARARVPSPDPLLPCRPRTRRWPSTRSPPAAARRAKAAATVRSRPARHIRLPPARARSPRSPKRSLAGLRRQRAEAGALAQGYWQILSAVVSSRSAAWRPRARHVDALGGAARRRDAHAGQRASGRTRWRRRSTASGPHRSPRPSSLRRAGQLQRFLQLVPDRVRPRRRGRPRRRSTSRSRRRSRSATAPRAAFADLESVLARGAIAAATRSVARHARRSSARPGAAEPRSAGRRSPPPSRHAPTTRSTLLERLYPSAWQDAAETADFDVIAATLDRLQAAAAAGDWGRRRAGAPRGVRHLRARARAAAARARAVALPGDRGLLLVRRGGPRRPRPADQAQGARERARRPATALDDALARSEEQIGSGPQSRRR